MGGYGRAAAQHTFALQGGVEMELRAKGLLSLIAFLSVALGVQYASAQRLAHFRQAGPNTAPKGVSKAPTKGPAEELPPSRLRPMQSSTPTNAEPFADDVFPSDEFTSYGPYDGTYCGPADCNPGGGGGGRWCCDLIGGQCFFTADYLYVRANFSEAQESFEQNIDQNPVTREFHNLDFDYQSSYRFGGGYRLCGCDEEIRFLFTRLRSPAQATVPSDGTFLVPLEPETPIGGQTLVDAEVDVKSYDLEFAKTIPLGAGCCGCGDACGDGCGDCCAPCCPTWDITWSGGLRVADAAWHRRYTAFDAQSVLVGDAVSRMDFDGVGAKTGLEGRRYFFPSGWLSVYLKGDISLLVGNVEIDMVRTIEGGTVPDFVMTQSTKARNIIPVTEIEAGISGQVTRFSRLSAGYLLSAWHDLGYRDEFGLGQEEFPLRYDDANILGFDGFFARLEVAF